MPDLELTLYIVSYGEDEDDNNGWFIAAHTPSEAFELWREYTGDTHKSVRVWEVPSLPDKAAQVDWPHHTMHCFDPGYEDLTTRAVRAAKSP